MMIVKTKYLIDGKDKFFVASDYGDEYWIYGFNGEYLAKIKTRSDVGMWKIKKLK